MPIFGSVILELILAGIPLALTGLATLTGFREVRQLRDITGDESRLTAIMGLTTRANDQHRHEDERAREPESVC